MCIRISYLILLSFIFQFPWTCLSFEMFYVSQQNVASPFTTPSSIIAVSGFAIGRVHYTGVSGRSQCAHHLPHPLLQPPDPVHCNRQGFGAEGTYGDNDWNRSAEGRLNPTKEWFTVFGQTLNKILMS